MSYTEVFYIEGRVYYSKLMDRHSRMHYYFKKLFMFQVKFKVKRPNESQQWKVVQIISLDVGKISSLNANAPSYHSIVHTVHAWNPNFCMIGFQTHEAPEI